MVVKNSPAGGRGCGVRVGPTRLEGLPAVAGWAAVKVKWPRPAASVGGALSQMLMGRWGRGVTAVEAVGDDGAVRWVDSDANRFQFDVEPNGRSERGVFFSVLYGFQEQGRGKDLVRLEEIGTAMISLDECYWEMQLQQQQQHKVATPEAAAAAQQLVVAPIRLRKDGWASDAILYVNVELVELNPTGEIKRMRSVKERARTNQSLTMRNDWNSDEPATYHEVLDLEQLLDLADKEDKVAVYRNKRNSDISSTSIGSSSTSTSGGASPEAGLTSKRQFLPWRRRRSRDFDKRSPESLSQELPPKCRDEDLASSWETREFTSRDAETKLSTPVFFASIDQRDGSAGGESACTALVAVLAAALHANHPVMPSRQELDALIREGSSEWRKLCDDEAHMERFPNRHFDLDTVLAARTRPIAVLHDKAFVGFFQPESFASLAGAMSFDDIWNEIGSNVGQQQQGHADVYIVSWNDHFFVLKVDNDCYYIIDTLGERLFEGCDKAYMLKFDGTSEMYSSTDKEEVIVTGKECCREFIKRFLAAIPVREELEIEKRGGGSDGGAPHRRLQIEFHFTVLQEDER